jgi:hypothetical protein
MTSMTPYRGLVVWNNGDFQLESHKDQVIPGFSRTVCGSFTPTQFFLNILLVAKEIKADTAEMKAMVKNIVKRMDARDCSYPLHIAMPAR